MACATPETYDQISKDRCSVGASKPFLVRTRRRGGSSRPPTSASATVRPELAERTFGCNCSAAFKLNYKTSKRSRASAVSCLPSIGCTAALTANPPSDRCDNGCKTVTHDGNGSHHVPYAPDGVVLILGTVHAKEGRSARYVI